MNITCYEDIQHALLKGEIDACARFMATRKADRGSPDYWYWLAQLYYRCGRFHEALEICFRLTREPEASGFHLHTLGDICAHLGYLHTGLTGLDALACRPQMQGEPAYHIRLSGYHYLGEDEAVLALPREDTIRPACIHEHYRSRSTMRLHGVAAGLQSFHQNWCSREAVAELWPQQDTGNYWCGQMALPRHLVVRGFACGFGDCVQWMRYACALRAIGVTIGWDSVFDTLITPGQPQPHDLQAARALREAGFITGRNDTVMWTTPFALLTALFPVLGHAATQRYLNPAPHATVAQLLGHIRTRARGRRCVGIFWSSCESNDMYARKSLLHTYLAPLWERTDDIHWVVLQRGYERTAWAASAWAADGTRFTLAPLQLTLPQTFALIDGLDGFVGNDGVLSHAAGAMGTPGWLLLNAGCADWRYERQGMHSAWYASLNVVRPQATGQWPTLVEQLVAALVHDGAPAEPVPPQEPVAGPGTAESAGSNAFYM